MLGAEKNPLILIQKHVLVVLRQIFFLKIKVIVDFYSWVKNLYSFKKLSFLFYWELTVCSKQLFLTIATNPYQGIRD